MYENERRGGGHIENPKKHFSVRKKSIVLPPFTVLLTRVRTLRRGRDRRDGFLQRNIFTIILPDVQ